MSSPAVWKFPIAAILLVAAWQWATVHANYGGNWTALYCTGGLQPHPPLVAAEQVYLFANSTGYDGQFYHYVAHDPFLRGGLSSYFDYARLRYRRILVPFLAWGLALGQPRWIDMMYEVVTLLSIGLGVYWSCKIAERALLPAAWGLLFLLMPATLVTADRLVVDGELAALTAAFLYYRRPSWKLFAVLVCAALTRETGILLGLAWLVYLMRGRDLRTAAIYVWSGAAAVAWYAYVQSRTAGASWGVSPIPFSDILSATMHPLAYPPDIPLASVVRLADSLALAGGLLAFGLVVLWLLRRGAEASTIAALLFVVMAIFVRSESWSHVFDFGRIYTPVLLCLAAAAAQYRKPWLLAPLAMMLPRIAIQFAPQGLGIVRRLM